MKLSNSFVNFVKKAKHHLFFGLSARKRTLLIYIGSVLFIFILNYMLYALIVFFSTEPTIILYPKQFDNLLIGNLSILGNIPSITISALTTLLAIFFTIIALSFNFKHLPDEIINKHIIFAHKTALALSVLLGFLLNQLFLIVFKFYNTAWSYVFAIDLIISLIIMILFFYWFVKNTNKKGIYLILQKSLENEKELNHSYDANVVDWILEDFVVESSGNYYIIKPKVPYRNVPKDHTAYKEDGRITSFDFAPFSAMIRVNYNELQNLIIKYADNISYLIICKNGTFVSRLELIYKVNFYEERPGINKAFVGKLAKMIKKDSPQNVSEISDWFLLLNASRTITPKEIEDDFGFLKQVLENETRTPQIKLIINTLEINLEDNLINAEAVLQHTISLIYNLKSKFQQSSELLRFMQASLKNIFIRYSLNLNRKFNSRYVSAVLNISDFIHYEFLTRFEKEQNSGILSQYSEVINENIDAGYQILKNTINLYFLEPDFYEFYLKEHMQQFIMMLQFYGDDPYDFNRNYYETTNQEQQLIHKKCEIVQNGKKRLKQRITDSAFHLLYLIEREKISSKITELVLDFLSYGDVFSDIDPAPTWMIEETLHPDTAFGVPSFPKNKFILLFLIHRNLENKSLIFPEWKFSQLHLAEDLKKTIECLTYETVKTWIKLTESQFNEIKAELIKTFSEAIKKCEENELDLITNSPIDSEIISDFKLKLINYWDERSTLRKLFKKYGSYERKLTKKPIEKSDKSFGFFFTFEKSYFIRNAPVSWARTLESDYGISLARNENEEIVKKMLSIKPLKKLPEKLEESLKLAVRKFKKEPVVVLIDTKKEIEFSKFSSFVHKHTLRRILTKEELENHYLGFLNDGKSQIPVYQIDNLNAILIVNFKKIARLVQYSPYKSSTEELYIEVSEITDEDLRASPTIKNPKTKVKIRILEKFRLEDSNKNALEGFSL